MDANYDHPEELVKQFVVAAHSDLATVQQMLAADPSLLNVNYRWGEDNFETPIGAAGHMGQREIAEFLLAQGAPLDICVAAMLGREATVKQMLAHDPQLAASSGAHGIPLLIHVALGGSVAIAEQIQALAPAAPPLLKAALHVATARDRRELVVWLLQNTAADVNAVNRQGETPLDVAKAAQNEALILLLKDNGAAEAAAAPA